jgi:hypothetical protein
MLLVERGGEQHRRERRLPVRLLDGRVPDLVLGLCENSASPWLLRLAARRGAGLAGVAALAVRREFPAAAVHSTNPKRPGTRYGFPVPEVEAWASGLGALAAPPTVVLRALPDMFAVWAMDEPLPATEATWALLGRLAAGVGAQPAGSSLDDLAVALPGTRVLNLQPRVAFATVCEPARVYNLTALEAAIKEAKQ